MIAWQVVDSKKISIYTCPQLDDVERPLLPDKGRPMQVQGDNNRCITEKCGHLIIRM